MPGKSLEGDLGGVWWGRCGLGDFFPLLKLLLRVTWPGKTVTATVCFLGPRAVVWTRKPLKPARKPPETLRKPRFLGPETVRNPSGNLPPAPFRVPVFLQNSFRICEATSASLLSFTTLSVFMRRRASASLFLQNSFRKHEATSACFPLFQIYYIPERVLSVRKPVTTSLLHKCLFSTISNLRHSRARPLSKEACHHESPSQVA